MFAYMEGYAGGGELETQTKKYKKIAPKTKYCTIRFFFLLLLSTYV